MELLKDWSKQEKKIVKVRKNRKPRVGMTYKKYMRSTSWEKRKNLYWQKHPKICSACLSTRYVQLHHRFYERSEFGFEPDKDLTPLCTSCHMKLHRIFGTRKNLRKQTTRFINEKLYAQH